MKPQNKIRTRTLPKEAEPYKWKPGQSGNPGGRPRKTSVSDAYARHIDSPLPDTIRLKLRLRKGATWADAMALGQLHSAVKGKTDAAREIADRLEGRARQPVDVSGGITVGLAERIERARKASEEE
jgi:hypothetical protein